MNKPVDTVGYTGIVESVEAQRYQDEYKYLEATCRFSTDLPNATYPPDKQHEARVRVPLTLESKVNPGDVVALFVRFESVNGARFQPALEAEVADNDS